MQESIFTKIINGAIPAYKIYEDSRTLAFLDIHPARPGHALIVPKSQVDRLEDLADEDYAAVMETVRKVMRRVVTVFGREYRACVKLEGFDIAHAHVHVIPCRDAADFWTHQDMGAPVDDEALAAMAAKLSFI